MATKTVNYIGSTGKAPVKEPITPVVVKPVPVQSPESIAQSNARRAEWLNGQAQKPSNPYAAAISSQRSVSGTGQGLLSAQNQKYSGEQPVTQDPVVSPEVVPPPQYVTPEKVDAPAPITYDPIKVDPSQTTSALLSSLLNSDSDYMQNARTRGLQLANERGLLNSSMAAEASQTGAISQAMPIAQSDSALYGDTNRANASNAVSVATQNANNALQAARDNADAILRANTTNATLANSAAQTQADLDYRKWATGQEVNQKEEDRAWQSSENAIENASLESRLGLELEARRLNAVAESELATLRDAGSKIAASIGEHNAAVRLIQSSDLSEEGKAAQIKSSEIGTRNQISLVASFYAVPGIDEILGDFGG